MEDYRQCGVDSEGQFTLNPGRVRELLQRFQLPDPAQYVLHLLSFLVGAGATRITVTTNRQQVCLEAEGAVLDQQVARAPFSALLRTQECEPHLVELALGLNALIGVDGGQARIVGLGGWEATYSAAYIELKDHPPNGRLTITAGPRFLEMSPEREAELIREAFAWCHVPIVIDGKPIDLPPVLEPESVFELHLCNERHPLRLPVDANLRTTRPVQAGFSALLALGRHRPGFRVISLGRCYEMPSPWAYDVDGWRVDMTVCTESLQKDLSQQAILENARYHNLVRFLRLQLENGSATLLCQIPPASGTMHLVDDLVKHLFRNQRSGEALAFQNGLVQHYLKREDNLPKGNALYRLGLMETLNGTQRSRLEDSAEAQVRKGRIILASLPETAEGRWARISADIAYADITPGLQAELQHCLIRPGAPPWLQESCCRWFLRHVNENHSWYLVRLARLAFDGGRPLEASAYLDQADSQGYSEAGGEDDTLELRAEIAAQRGQVSESLRFYERLLTRLRDRYGQHSLRLGLTLVRMAKLLDHLGETKQARSYRDWSRNLRDQS